MNKIVKYILIGLLVLGALWAAAFFIKSNSKSAVSYEVQNPFIANIEKKNGSYGKIDSRRRNRDQTTDFGYHPKDIQRGRRRGKIGGSDRYDQGSTQ